LAIDYRRAPTQRILAIADRVLALAAEHLPAVTVMEGSAMAWTIVSGLVTPT